MQRHGVAHPSIQMRTVETLDRHQASGKLKRFVPLPRQRRVNSVISLGANTRKGGPQKPVPRLVYSCVRSP